MSLNSALLAASSGLAAVSRQAMVVADNVANSGTDGFAPRAVGLSSVVAGGQGTGVRVTGIDRQADPLLSAALRMASASEAASQATTTLWRELETVIGTGDAPGALGERISALEAALVQARTAPESEPRLARIVDEAGALVQKFAAIDRTLTEARARTDSDIASDIDRLNTGLKQVEALNGQITRELISGGFPNGLIDERARIVDSLSQIVPLRELPQGNGSISLMTDGGALVLNRTAAQFDVSGLPGGAAVEVTLNGRPVALSANGPLAGGRLDATLQIRDQMIPQARTQVDALAADLAARFSGPEADPTLAAGVGGLIMAAGPDPDAPGVAGRLRVNPLADPAQGGDLWRLRSGLGAAAPGPVGETVVLDRMLQAMDMGTQLGAGETARDFGGHAARLLSDVGIARNTAEGTLAFASANATQLHERQAADGVDTDAELQRLLQVEQAYAANARVMRAVDDMLRQLMEI